MTAQTVVADTAAQPRLPWLDALVAEPEKAVRDLIRGYVGIGRDVEPTDTAAGLLGPLPADHPARAAFDDGCLKTLEFLRRATTKAPDQRRYLQGAAFTATLLAVVRRIAPHRTVADLHRRYMYWFNAFETVVVDRGLDLRRDYWLTLALTQDKVEGEQAPRKWMPLWFNICADAGGAGRLPLYYLSVGMIGLRRLPLGAEHSSNEEAVCHGLGRWAMNTRPEKDLFLKRWREIDALYPRAASFWPPLVEDVIAAQEENIHDSFPAAAWWRAELRLPQPPAKRNFKRSRRKETIQPPPREAHEGVLKDIAHSMAQLAPRIKALMQSHRRYADATGDVYYLVRTACNVGMRLIRDMKNGFAERGAQAAELARLALDYSPRDAHAWALWRDGLVEQGLFRAAEIVGWEAIRRFPENPQYRNQLASLLAERLNRAEEAQALLRDTIRAFPDDAVARTQLASLLAERLNRAEEAQALLRDAIRAFPDNAIARTQLATLIWQCLGDQAGALAVLDELLAADKSGKKMIGFDPIGHPRLRDNIAAGRLPPRVRTTRVIADVSGPAPGVDFPDALARRALFRYENGLAGLEADGGWDRDAAVESCSPYGRYVAARIDGAQETGEDGAFALAFAAACRGENAAALRGLLDRATGLEREIAGVGLKLLDGAAEKPVVAGAEAASPDAPARRFQVIVNTLWSGAANDNTPAERRRAGLRLVSDFAACNLAIPALLQAA